MLAANEPLIFLYTIPDSSSKLIPKPLCNALTLCTNKSGSSSQSKYNALPCLALIPCASKPLSTSTQNNNPNQLLPEPP